MLDEKIDFYLSILNPVDQEMPQSVKVSCKSCQGERFFVDFGYNICENCGITQGHALGFFDQREYESTSDFIFDKNQFISENTTAKKDWGYSFQV